MTDPTRTALSKRERQVMDALYRLRRATVSELVEEMREEATYSAVRAVLRTLREKGEVDFKEEGPRYVYFPSTPADQARARALDHLVRTFFDGSPEAAAVALLVRGDVALEEGVLRQLEARIARAKEEGR